MNYSYGYCGMPCALCSRYHTNGKSRCPGCSCGGYYTDMCRVFRCCRERELVHCGSCAEFPCKYLSGMNDFKDLDTGHAKQRTCAAISSEGFEKWYEEYAERAEMLAFALAHYNDGRMKRFLCELFIQNDAATLREIMRRAEGIDGTPKERGARFKETVASAALATPLVNQ